MKPLIQRLRRAMLLQDGAGMTDAQLLECFIQRNDEAAFEALMRFHGPMVFGVCERILANHHDAEEAFQATFLVLARKAGSISTRQTVANWLYGAAHRTALNARRARTRRVVKETKVAANSEAVDRRQQDQWSDVAPLLDQELSRLPEKYRTPVVLCDLEGKSHKEAARQVGCPEGTLSSRLARARNLLANRLTRRGLVLSAGSMVTLLSENAASASVSALLADSIVEAARMSAVSQAATAGVISSNVAALTEGTVKSMLLSALRNAAAVFALLVALSLGAGGLIYQMRAAAPVDALRVSGASDSKEAAKRKLLADEEAIQGTWSILRIEAVGPDSQPRDVLPDTHGTVRLRLSFTAHKLTSSSESDLQKMRKEHHVYAKQQQRTALKLFRAWTWANEEIAYRLDATKLPRRMDLKTAAVEEPERLRGAIYRLKGDDLQICLGSEEGTEPPADFEIRRAKSGSILITLKRDKDELPNAPFQPAYLNDAEKADEFEPIAKIKQLGGKIERDEKLPGRPIVGISFENDSSQLSDKDLHLLNQFKTLRTLDLSDTQITDARLKELNNLTALSLVACRRLADDGLKEIRDLKSLETLDVSGTKVTDTGLKVVGELKNLTTLSMQATPITDDGLKQLRSLTSLTTLNISETKITDDGLKELSTLKNLTTLLLRGARINGLGLKNLIELKRLTTLNLCNSTINDVGMKELSQLEKLKVLDLTACKQLTDIGMSELAGLRNLTQLKLTQTAITDAGLRHLAGLTNLRELHLYETQITDTGLIHLARLNQLQVLDLIGTQITGAGFARLTGLGNLQVLGLRNTRTTDAGMPHLGGLTNLRVLGLEGTEITDIGAAHLMSLAKLQELGLKGTHVTAVGVAKLEAALPIAKIAEP